MAPTPARTPLARTAFPTRRSSVAWPSRPPLPQPTPAEAPGPDALYALRPGAIWKFLKAQPASFWCVNLYLFFEYVRPQSIYTWLEGPPWAQMILLLCLGSFFLEGKMFQGRTAADACLAFFCAVLVLSSMQAHDPSIAYGRLTEFFTWVLIYLLISNTVTTEGRFLVFALGFLLYSFKMSQHATRDWASAGFAFRDWGVTGAPGWFQNSGEYGVQMTIFVPLSLYFIASLKKYWGRKTRLLFYTFPLTGVIGTIGSSSRGAMLGLTVAAFFMLAKTRYKLKGTAAMLGLGLLVWILLPEESLDRFRSIGEDETSMSRRTYWTIGLDAMSRFPILGVGFNNWHAYTRSLGLRVSLPHNIFIEAGAELGYLGLFAFIALIFATFWVNWRSRRTVRSLGERGGFVTNMAHGLDAALVGYLVSGFFVTVLYYPFFWINLAMTVALHTAARTLVSGKPGAGTGRRTAALGPRAR